MARTTKKPKPTARKSTSGKSTNGKSAPSKTRRTTVSHAQQRTNFQQMLLIRRFEEKAGQLYGMGLIGGFCHLYIGQ